MPGKRLCVSTGEALKPRNVFLLIVLSVLWGASFSFMRYLSPIFGPVMTADMRILIGGGVLCVAFILTGVRLDWRKNWKKYTLIGLLNSGAPFLFYSFAALHIPGSVSSIINSLAPVSSALFSAIWLDERFNTRKTIGLVAGVSGVVVITSAGSIEQTLMSYLAVGACVCATICYGLAGVYVKKHASGIRPRILAATSQVLAGLIIFPFIFASPPPRGRLRSGPRDCSLSSPCYAVDLPILSIINLSPMTVPRKRLPLPF